MYIYELPSDTSHLMPIGSLPGEIVLDAKRCGNIGLLQKALPPLTPWVIGRFWAFVAG